MAEKTENQEQKKSGVVKISSGGSADKFWHPRFWDGMTFCAWIKLLNSARWRVAPFRLPMAFIVTCLAFNGSFWAFWQKVLYGRKIRDAKLVGEPIFIVGHWRSGTTLLHEYMMRDERFACSDTYECFAPAHFLVSGPIFRPWVKYLMPNKRPMDNMAAGLDRPQEDEFAICALGMNSPYRDVAFPNGKPIDEKYLTLRDVSDSDRKRWLDSLEYILKALTVAYNKTIVLKSPPHTARVKTIRERFPNAKFVHISRDPYTLFPSTVNLWTKLAKTHGFQNPKGGPELEEKVLRNFEQMYDAFCEDVQEIPQGNFCEVTYDELVAQPVETIEKIYRELGIDGFDERKEEFTRFAATQKSYRKNKFELSPEMKETINKRWKKYFDRYCKTE
ncbi:MAG: sulfotransferase [Thermoguttaceae bacterium]|nr:sulfotransferase [Thermoguttaceae bacterium]